MLYAILRNASWRTSHSAMGWRYFNVAEDVWPRSERQVDHQDDETGHNDHRGRAPPALKVGDRAGQRGKRHLPGEPERHHIRDDHQEDREQAVDDVAEHVHVAAGSSGDQAAAGHRAQSAREIDQYWHVADGL